jgi:hypothetical protein
MKAETVEKVYRELVAHGIARELPPNQIAFNVIAQTLSAGEPMSIEEAIEKIRGAESLKDRHRTIDMEIVIHNESVEVSFGVWAGNRDFKGATLENAVNSCLVSNNEFSGSQDEADRVAAQAMAYQESKL